MTELQAPQSQPQPQPQPYRASVDSALTHSIVETIIDYDEPQQPEAQEERARLHWLDPDDHDSVALHWPQMLQYGEEYIQAMTYVRVQVARAAACELTPEEFTTLENLVGIDNLITMVNFTRRRR